VIVRPSEASDLPGLVDLLARAFKVTPDAPFLRADLMKWKYWEPRSDWTEPRSYLVEEEGRIVAHTGIWPAVIQVDGTDRRGIHMIDWAADPDALGAGARLLQHMLHVFDFVYASGGEIRARAIFPLLGFREVARSWKAARPLRPWKMAVNPMFYEWRLPARILRNVGWSLLPRERSVGGWSFERADPGDLAPPSASTAAPADARDAEIPRSAAFFQYLDRCPGCRCFTYRLMYRGVTKGMFMLMQVRHHARLSVWLQDSTVETRRIAYSLALRAARSHRDVIELVVMGSTQVAVEAAAGSGFRIRNTTPVFFRARNGLWHDRSPPIQFQLCDLDATFFDDGGTLALC
jgi:hypothetical protein